MTREIEDIGESLKQTTDMLREYERLTSDLNNKAKGLIERLAFHRKQYEMLGSYIFEMEEIIKMLPKAMFKEEAPTRKLIPASLICEKSDTPRTISDEQAYTELRKLFLTRMDFSDLDISNDLNIPLHQAQRIFLTALSNKELFVSKNSSNKMIATVTKRECPACHGMVNRMGFASHRKMHEKTGNWPANSTEEIEQDTNPPVEPEGLTLTKYQKAGLKKRMCPACHQMVSCLGFNNHRAKHERNGEWPSEEPASTSPICEKSEPEPFNLGTAPPMYLSSAKAIAPMGYSGWMPGTPNRGPPPKLAIKGGVLVQDDESVEEMEPPVPDCVSNPTHGQTIRPPVENPSKEISFPFKKKGEGILVDQGRKCIVCGLNIDEASPHPYCDKCWKLTTKKSPKVANSVTRIVRTA